jgi:hypothetical protein
MKTAYLDCIAGASGDMLLGALVDAGLPFEDLRAELGKLNIFDFKVSSEKVLKNGISATKFHVFASDNSPERFLRDLREIIEESDLSESVKQRAVRVFTRICEVEAGIHGMSVDSVHLHEVGGIDAIVDVVGVLAGFEMLGIKRVVVSPLPMGRGFVNCAHGQIPLPAPATIALLKGVPIYGSPIEKELVTPTGAALLTELAHSWGSMPAMTLDSLGYGAGTRDLVIPNVVRLMIGASTTENSWETETVTELETNLDNDTGETISHTLQRLMDEGALDAVSIPAMMKKGRPAHVVKVMAKPADADRLERILFEETHTLGIRRTETRRDFLPRRFETAQTPFGSVKVKIATLPSGNRRITPEFEDCRKHASQHGVPLQQVVAAARHPALEELGSSPASES